MEKLLFIVPPTISYDKFKYPSDNVRTLSKRDGFYGSVLTDMPLGVLALSAYLKKHNDINVSLIDFNVVLNKLDVFSYLSFQDFFLDYFNSLPWQEFNPTIIGISALFATTYSNMLDIAACCRKVFPNAMIIGGGGVPTNMYRNIFADSSYFDGLFYGESERSLLGFINAVDKQAYLECSSACMTRKKLTVGTAPKFDFIDNLDEIPVYDYNLVDLDDYRLNPTISAYPGIDSSGSHVTYMTSRGCPFHCIFCAAHSVHGRKMRYYSLDRVREDFLIIMQQHGVHTIVFQDDHFMASKERAHTIIDLLRSLGMSAFFPNSLTLYALDKSMLEALNSVGVKLLVLAIESGSARVLKNVMRKPLNLKIAERVVRDCRALSIDTDVNIVIGLPGETKQDIEDARVFLIPLPTSCRYIGNPIKNNMLQMRPWRHAFDGVNSRINHLRRVAATSDEMWVMEWVFLRTLDATWFRIYTAIPLPGSEMYEICIEKGYISNEITDGDFKKAVIHTEDFTAEYIQRMAYTMNLDLNFVSNSEVRLGNFSRALKEFENTIKLKDDHAFAHYFAAKCLRSIGDEFGYTRHRDRYEEILKQSLFWREYATEFSLVSLP